MDNIDLYEELCERLVMGENEEYVPDGVLASFAVYNQINDVKADCYFLYMTDYETFSEPYARIALDMSKGNVIEYLECEDVPFEKEIVVPDDLPEDEAYECYADAYMSIRDFVFQESINEEQKVQLKNYINVFEKVTENQFKTCYLELAQNFLKWAESVM